MKQYPPYAGMEPYLYLAFADADTAAVWPVMRALLQRGTRVWYCTGEAGSAEKLRGRQARAEGAALTLVYLTDEVASDRDTKSMILVNQKNIRPIVALDPDDSDRLLAMGLKETVPLIPLRECRTAGELEEALIRADGFTQELLGEPVAVVQSHKLRHLTAFFSALAAVLLALGFTGVRYLHWFQPAYEDTVSFTDPVIQAAARQAAGGALTEESLAGVHVLQLKELPGNWDDLALMPALEEIILPQRLLVSGFTASEDPGAVEASGTAWPSMPPDGDYVIVLAEGGGT